jgi:hypothetical protein
MVINLGFVLPEVNAESVHLVHEQRDTCLLNPARRDSQRFAELILLPVGVPVA